MLARCDCSGKVSLSRIRSISPQTCLWMISSSLCRNVNGLAFRTGQGHRDLTGFPEFAINVRVGNFLSIVSSVNTRPLGLNTLRLTLDNEPPKECPRYDKLSWPASWTIRSSAASSSLHSPPLSTQTKGSLGTRCHLSETSTTSNSQRLATRYTSSLTGQESASTKILTGEARPLERADTRQGLT
ncbi:MAG: hypothetical protein CM1200mP14_28740 [Gammaproteobacteria bacterium]|nr:MAG: hypothetical protein CM1200mP14_28740 [Gammaproteobacteria bacterium]